MEEEYNDLFEELLSLPHEGIELLETESNESPQIRITKNPTTPNVYIIKQNYLAPIISYKESLDSIPLEEIENYNLIPVESVKLPMKLIAVDGYYPNDKDYPLIDRVYLEVIGVESNKVKLWLGEFIEERKRERTPTPEIIWIGAVGDMMLNRGIDTLLRTEGLESVFGDTLPILNSLDTLMGNLEGAVTDRGEKSAKTFTFRFKDDVLKYLKEAGFNYLSVTNNHIYDYGEIGVIDTIDNLKKYQIPTSGIGRTVDEASIYYEREGVRILSIAAYPREKNGFDGLKETLVTEKRAGVLFQSDLSNAAIKNMCSSDTFDIIYVHGGDEWRETPTTYQEQLYRSYIDMGVDLVIGSHPHVLQRFEHYKEGFISYSMGNFLFPLMKGWYTGEESMILIWGLLDNRIITTKVHPVTIDNRIISLDKTGYIKERFYKLIK